MAHNYVEYWERCWQEDNASTDLYQYLEGFYGLKSNEIGIFKEHGVKNVCDAACGFGAYTVALASNGFSVDSFDISETSVEITKNALKKYGWDASRVKVAGILNTGYEDGMFDAVVAHAVIDHLTYDDAGKALTELNRIVKRNGLILVSFDIAHEDDYNEPHVSLPDGTMEYTCESLKGMLFHPYDWAGIDELLKDRNVIYKADKGDRERVVILKA